MRIIRVTTQNEISVHEYPAIRENEILQMLIGNDCSMFEHVMPRRLYQRYGAISEVTRTPGEAIAMLVDEEGLLKTNQVNLLGSMLYETDKHGSPIVGNILIVGKKWFNSGISFCGIEDKQFEKIYPQLERALNRIKENTDKSAGVDE